MNTDRSAREVYERLAPLYDRAGWTGFSRRAAPLYLQLADRCGVHRGHVIDLACGEGTACGIFRDAGWHVTGVDISGAMLEEASRKHSLVEFFESDMRNYEDSRQFDLVTCMFDSINCLRVPGDVADTFRRARALLRRGGLFVFDVVTRLEAEMSAEMPLVREQGDVLSIAFHSWIPESFDLEHRFTVFARTREAWQRTDLIAVSRIYDLDWLRATLSTVGLEVITTVDLYRPGLPIADADARRVAIASIRR